ncbi:MAG: F0F1 ATP synthase subunit epsilon [Hyphomicrobiales bacterium]|nr:MAG: F0F1 ATP synthase subunit epsilon [Hyphomicrobiales bacterium]
MAEAFNFELVSPERLVFKDEVTEVVVPGVDGYFAVLKSHAPVIASLNPGYLDLTLVSGETQRMYVRGGFADVNKNGLKILAEKAIPVAEVTGEFLSGEIDHAQAAVEASTSDGDRVVAELRVSRLKDIEH